MGVLSAIGELRVRAMSSVLDAAHPGAAPWDELLHDLGPIGADARPVVIQGGLSTDAYLYEPLKRVLEARGFDVAATHLDLHGYATLQRDAANLAREVDAASARSIARGSDGLVNVVAHSKGGLSTRWYLQRMGGVEHVAQLVTIGTPHNGSAPYGARIGALATQLPGMRAVKQLSHVGPEVLGLNRDLRRFMQESVAARPEFRIVSIAGDMDLPGLRGTDGLVSTGAAHVDATIPGVTNLVFRGAGAHHGAIAGQLGLFEPTIRSATTLLAGGTIDQASAGATLLAHA